MIYDMILQHIENYADILAIPFFLLASYYFISKRNKTPIEYLLTIFVIIGTIADTLFTLKFMISSPKH